MKKMMMIAVMMVALGAFAATETVGAYTWTYNTIGNGTAVVSVSPKPTGSVTLPSSLGGKPVTVIGDEVFSACDGLRRVTIPASVTSIGRSAFADCSALTSVTIPRSVTFVGESAFSGCSGLQYVTIPQCVCDNGMWSAFDADTITKIVISEGVTRIGDSAFAGCSNLTGVTIPDSVTSIGDYAFEDCYSLRQVAIPSGVARIGEGVFAECFSLERVTIPYGVLTIGASAFLECDSLRNVTIPNTVTNIGEYAFTYCASLTDLTIPDSVADVGENAFFGCCGLERVTIPQSLCDTGMESVFDKTLAADVVIADSVTRIADGAFADFANLTGVAIPASVMEIGDGAFRNCYGLKNIVMPKSVFFRWDSASGRWVGRDFYDVFEWIPDKCAWENVVILDTPFTDAYGDVPDLQYAYGFAGMRNLRSVTFPGCVRGFSTGAFDNCPRLERVTISGGGTGIMDPSAYFWEIGEYAFLGCVSLKHVDIPDGVWAIGWRAFYGCASLESVDIPASVAWIADEAFCGCSGLTSVSLPGGVMGLGSEGASELIGGVRAIGDRAFAECRGLTRIEIPGSVKEIGDGAFWNCYALKDLVVPRSVFYVWDGANDRWAGRDLTEVFGLDTDAYGKWYQYAWENVVILDVPSVDGYGDIPDMPIFGGFHGYVDMPNLKRVTLPSCVRGFGSFAFCDLPLLERVTISGGGTGMMDSSAYSCEIGEYAFRGCVSLTHVDIPDGVWAIMEQAFYGCSSLESVDIPASVEWIADEAFYGCSSLTSLSLPGGVMGLGSEGTAEVIGGVRAIGDRAFAECRGLTRIEIPDSVKEIGDGAFRNCYGLKELVVPRSVFYRWDSTNGRWMGRDIYDVFEWVPDKCAWETVVILDTPSFGAYGDFPDVQYAYGFAGMRNLRSVTLPGNVRGFSSGAFDNCPRLERVTISGGGTGMMDPSAYSWEIGEYAFFGCVSLKHVDIPDGVSMIRGQAFYGCASLESIDIPASVAWIEDEAFYGCSSLTGVSLPGGAMGLGSEGAAELIGGVRAIGDRAFAECSGLTRIEIPASVKEIGEDAFRNCYALKDLVVPRSVFFVWDGANDRWVGRDVGEVFGLDPDANGKQYQHAWETVVLLDIPPTAYYEDVPDMPIITRFSEMPNLRSVTLPGCVRGIESYAFCGLLRLERVTISCDTAADSSLPSDWSIGEWAFYGCVNLTHVDIPDGLWAIKERAFYGCSSLESVDIPASVEWIADEAFYGCSSLTGVSLPGGSTSFGSGVAELIGGVRVIGDRVFAECRGLTRIEIPASVKEIGEGAFRNCYALKDLVVPRSVFFRWDSANGRWVGRDLYDVFECLDERGLPLQFMWENVVLLDIPPIAGYGDVPDQPIATGFRDMPNLRSVSLPGCVRAYDVNAFYNCPMLENVTISGDTVADPSLPSDWWIGEWAFSGCVNLTHVDIPDGVWAIKERAFYGCSSLKSVSIPSSVVWIADEAFYGCSSLASVAFLGNAPSVDQSFSGVAAHCVAYILPSSTGWGVEVGEKWKGLTLLYWYFAGFPFIENDSDIIVALAGTADRRLYAMITNMAEYYAYWEWAHVVKNRVGVLAGTPAVKASPHAAAAYLLGATELFDNEPTITITGLKMGPASASRLANRGGDNSMTVTVTVKDGDRPVLADAAKVATLFEATSDLGDWDGTAKLTPSVEVLEGEAATMRFKVTFGGGTVKRAFLRIRH